jgi:hypothetical protein
MMIFMLAAAMTVAMLIATAFAIHQENQRAQFAERSGSIGRFGLR